jgi:hypothetical protein
LSDREQTVLIDATGLATPRMDTPTPASPSKKVQFDLGSAETTPKRRNSDPDVHRHDERGRSDGQYGSHERSRSDSPSSVSSGDTIELPPRFDEHGRRKGDDPVADRLEEVLNGIFSSGRRRK